MVYEYTIRKGKNGIRLRRGKAVAESLRFNQASIAANWMKEHYKTDELGEEYLWLVAMDADCNVLGISLVAQGGTNFAVVSTASVAKRVLLLNAVTAILVHNHPSGTAYFSQEDRKVTERFKTVFQLLDMTLADHIVLGNGYYSYAEEVKASSVSLQDVQ